VAVALAGNARKWRAGTPDGTAARLGEYNAQEQTNRSPAPL